MAHSLSAPDSDDPVSYTHLDVYKRQPQSRGKGMGMESLLAQQLLARLTQWDKGAYVEYC